MHKANDVYFGHKIVSPAEMPMHSIWSVEPVWF